MIFEAQSDVNAVLFKLGWASGSLAIEKARDMP